MNIFKRTILLYLCLLAGTALATHNRAGEIQYRHLSGLTYEVTIVTCTKTSSNINADYIENFDWGDGTDLDSIPLVNQVVFPNDITQNTYVGIHSYQGSGVYIVSYVDPNRNAAIVNIQNSVNTAFFNKAMIRIDPGLGHNNSSILLSTAHVHACLNQPFIHNPNAFDVDGDSISYELVVPQMALNKDVLYTFPDEHPSGANNQISLDPITGDFVWTSPRLQGEYNIAIRVSEWRYNERLGRRVLIGYVIRDMQIPVGFCQNQPPVIDTLENLCVEAGDSISFLVHAWDSVPKGNGTFDEVTLSASGGPFIQAESPAVFPTNVTNDSAVSAVFSWKTACSHVRKQPYQVSFRAEDDGSPISLVAVRTVLITVVGPAPQNPQALPSGNSLNLSWNKSHCFSNSNAITGYKIYRKIDQYGFNPDTCETGVPSYTGYVQVGSTTSQDDTTFTDNDGGKGLLHGINYCYMVVACYGDGAESYASVEFCGQLIQDVPIITHVTVNTTQTTGGSDTIRWIKPTEMDTVQFPGPYSYEVYQVNTYGTTGTFSQKTTQNGIDNTEYVDNTLNTTDNPNAYRIDMYSGSDLVGSTNIASSVYLSTTPSDEEVQLSWQENVPWVNSLYVIYRETSPGVFDSIGTSMTQSYVDDNLVNGQEYCYKVKSIGSYSDTSIVNPIENWSQERCAIPLDNVPPCTPSLSVEPDCDNAENLLSWRWDSIGCKNDDLEHYKIYFTPVLDSNVSVISIITDINDTTYRHNYNGSIAGCYAISAVDSIGNESALSDTICIDNCPTYELPNVFTPDGDGFNNILNPFPYQFVESIKLEIYNRWGQIVFKTEDPDIDWDGRHMDSGDIVPDGVYYYVVDVQEIRLTGIETRTLTGFVHLLNDVNAITK